MPLPRTDQDPAPALHAARWFAEEVRPHERGRRSYLHGSFPAVRDHDHVAPEAFLRTGTTQASNPLRSAKSEPHAL